METASGAASDSAKKKTPLTIGVLALQGDYEAHARAFESAGARTVLVRKPEELAGIKAWLEEHYEKNVKSVSFLLHSAHGFKQAPYQEITKEQFDELKAGVKSLTAMQEITGGDLALDECATGACPIK